MTTYIALLRGINVGGNNKVPMNELKAMFENLGFSGVQTYINSGNVIFKGKAKELKNIEPTFEKCFGFPIKFLILKKTTFTKIHDTIPADWKNDSEQKSDVMFLWKDYDNKETLETIETSPKVDTVIYVDGAILWHLKKKDMSKSKMNDLVGTELYKHMTVRNINTVRKLHTLL